MAEADELYHNYDLPHNYCLNPDTANDYNDPSMNVAVVPYCVLM